MPVNSRNVAIVLSVVLLHVGFIYAVYSNLLVRTVELAVPVVLLAQLIAPKIEPPIELPIEPPKPKTLVPPPPAQQPVKRTAPKTPVAKAALPTAIKDPSPAVNAPTGAIAPQPAPAAITTPVAAGPAPPAAPALPVAPSTPLPSGTAAVQLPSSDADYLQNSPPPYPATSRRLNEQGTSTLRVLIGADGIPQRAEVIKSSGFDRLDSAAVATAMRWRYVPGKRGGVAQAMSVTVPIVWVLN